MGGLSGKDILKAKPKSGFQKVSTPEWGENGTGHVYVRRLRASGYATIRDLAKKLGGPGGITPEEEIANVLAWCIVTMCGSDGKVLFKAVEANKLMELEFAPLNRCFMAAMDVNGFIEEAGDDAAKNSQPTRT